MVLTKQYTIDTIKAIIKTAEKTWSYKITPSD